MQIVLTASCVTSLLLPYTLVCWLAHPSCCTWLKCCLLKYLHCCRWPDCDMHPRDLLFPKHGRHHNNQCTRTRACLLHPHVSFNAVSLVRGQQTARMVHSCWASLSRTLDLGQPWYHRLCAPLSRNANLGVHTVHAALQMTDRMLPKPCKNRTTHPLKGGVD